MRTETPNNYLGFKIKASAIRGGIFIPKYYDPEIGSKLSLLSHTHDLVSVSTLVAENAVRLSTGHEIGKMAYGTGEIPFIRTSDISNWEIKTDPKQGVSQEIYDQYAARQNVRAGDIFFVRDGTYLIGQSCFVTQNDLPCLYQSHLLKIRVADKSRIPPALLFACLNAPIVKNQIRTKKFTADIIDTIGNRFSELVLPIPKDREKASRIANAVRDNVATRSILREYIRKIPFWSQGILSSKEDNLPQDFLQRIESTGNKGFNVALSAIRAGIFMPKFYDPILESDLHALSETHELVSLTSLIQQGVITWATGIEVGKMAYGTGEIPFIRTSDMANWELKSDPKQNVSTQIYEENNQDVAADDIFVVRDGTYLVGTSSIVTEQDDKVLYCGGLYKLRVKRKDKLDPFLLLALLNTPIVRRQMRSKQFTRDIIDTMGKRFLEIYLPLPKDISLQRQIADEVRQVIALRGKLRNEAKHLAFDVEHQN